MNDDGASGMQYIDRECQSMRRPVPEMTRESNSLIPVIFTCSLTFALLYTAAHYEVVFRLVPIRLDTMLTLCQPAYTSHIYSTVSISSYTCRTQSPYYFNRPAT